jgi:hypothetical protein
MGELVFYVYLQPFVCWQGFTDGHAAQIADHKIG